MAAESKARLRPWVIFGTGGSKPTVGDHTAGAASQQPRDALIPAQPIPPAHSGPAWQPARAAALGLPRGEVGAGQGFVRTPLGRPHLPAVQPTGHERRILVAHLAVALLPR